VFGFHFCRPLTSDGPLWLRDWVGSGFVAVSFFFVLSGFILAVSHRERLRDGTLDPRRFLTRRVSRMLPSYLLALALLLPLALVPSWGAATGAFRDPSPLRVLAAGLGHLTMLHAWWPPTALSWNLPGWSVSVELGCYFAFLLLASRMARLETRRLWRLALALWLLGLAATLAYSRFAPEAASANADASLPLLDVIKLWPPARFPEFFFGVALGLAWRAESRPPRWLAPAAMLAIALVLTHSHTVPYAVLHNALLLPAFGALLWSLASARGAIAKLLGSRPFVSVGRATYALYILQMPLMYWLLLASQAAGVALPGTRFLAAFVPLVLATTALVHLTVERRGRKWLQEQLDARTGQVVLGVHGPRAAAPKVMSPDGATLGSRVFVDEGP
jgi:peptidoglycan/LPS O-acetylase OafA/YrhL